MQCRGVLSGGGCSHIVDIPTALQRRLQTLLHGMPVRTTLHPLTPRCAQ